MLFKDFELENKFIRQGFVVLPLLGDKEIILLKELYSKSCSPSPEGLQPTLRIGDVNKNIELHNEIGKIIQSCLEKWFQIFAFNANHFISKSALDPNEFKLHQDWNVVDESRYVAAHIWIPLQDTGETNGGLFVVEGSHKFFDNHRSGSCGIVFIDRTEKVKRYVTSLSLKAGEAVIYQQALFHGSYANKSNDPRLVCLCSIRPTEAPMKYYHRPKPFCSYLEVYEITPEVLFERIAELEKGNNPYKNIDSNSSFDKKIWEAQNINNEVFELKL